MKWEDYYDKFWDWAESTRISRISSITDFTSAAEVVEAAEELFDEVPASRLVKRAIGEGVKFSPEQIVQLAETVDEETGVWLSKTARETLLPSKRKPWKNCISTSLRKRKTTVRNRYGICRSVHRTQTPDCFLCCSEAGGIMKTGNITVSVQAIVQIVLHTTVTDTDGGITDTIIPMAANSAATTGAEGHKGVFAAYSGRLLSPGICGF